MSKIELRGVSKKYPHSDRYAVNDFNLVIEDGEFIVFVGPSGCGKSTTLRMIAGLEDITGGQLIIDGEVVNDKSSKDRDVAMVFQSYALYPHMSVRDNIGYGLKLRNYPRAEIKQRVEQIAADLGLSNYLERKPQALSGGERQRVALGRAMVRAPKIYLLDEPLSNLDAKLRVSTRAEISRLHRVKGAITIYVTHDQVEAMTMATRIVLMSMGYVQQIGTPQELYLNPKNLFVATFIGMPPMNIIKGTYADQHFTCQGFTITVSGQDGKILNEKGYAGKEVYLGVRAGAIKFKDVYYEVPSESAITVKPVNVEYLGETQNVFFEPEPGNFFVASINPKYKIEVDEAVDLFIDTSKLYFFDAETEESVSY